MTTKGGNGNRKTLNGGNGLFCPIILRSHPFSKRDFMGLTIYANVALMTITISVPHHIPCLEAVGSIRPTEATYANHPFYMADNVLPSSLSCLNFCTLITMDGSQSRFIAICRMERRERSKSSFFCPSECHLHHF